MARYTGPMTRKSRRLGTDLVGNDKSFERRPFPPGMHGRGRTKDSEYSQQLKEKQKARFAYGVMEKQFRRYYQEATRSSMKTGDILLQILESRLDNVVYRAGFARTRRQARQFVSHGHFSVNGTRVNIPSYRVRAQDVIDLAEKSANIVPIVEAREMFDTRTVPAWMDSRPTQGRIIIHSLPTRDQIVIDLQEQLIVELYSR
ncbi:MAG: 30S ribosomal protein S4 [Propionibacteriaceae bacterium]|nr:30S ribosomal protein S4 [Propionibacteriaceae bacterium]